MPRARVRVAAAIAGVVVAGGLATWWTLREDEPRRQPRPAAQPPARKLDVAAFRAELAQRKAKVDALRTREDPKPDEPAKPYEPPQASTMIALLVDPECNIGPGELCKGLEDIIRACDVGDAAACLAVAQYLQDTSPRPPRGVLMFLLAACKRGEASACERVEALKQPFTGTCADDPIACATHALRAQDRYLLGQACEAGVAETCAWLGKNVGNDLREGKPTLPLLIAMERGSADERAIVRHAIEHGEVARLADIVGIVRATGAIAATRDAARAEADKARASLDVLPSTPYRDALLDLSVRSVERSS